MTSLTGNRNSIEIFLYSWRAQFALSGFFLCLSLFWSLGHAHRSHRWTDFDDLYVMWRISAQGCALWGCRWYASPFRGSNPPKNNFEGLNRRFKAKIAKSKNMHIIKCTASIPIDNFFWRSVKGCRFCRGPKIAIFRWLSQPLEMEKEIV